MRDPAPPPDNFREPLTPQTNIHHQVQRGVIHSMRSRDNLTKMVEGGHNFDSSDKLLLENNSTQSYRSKSSTLVTFVHTDTNASNLSPTIDNHNSPKTNRSKEEPVVGSPTDESLVGSLPRTLSTSVLRIKNKRSFWESVVG